MRINKSLIAYVPTTGAGSGTVTSVGFSATMPTGLSAAVSGSPITSSGTIGLTLSYAAGYAIPTTIKQSNWDDAYTFVAAFPTQTGNSGRYLTTNGSSLSWDLININNLTGTLSVAKGGTGATTLTGVLIGDGTNAFTAVTGGPNQILRVNGTATGYEFFTASFLTNPMTLNFDMIYQSGGVPTRLPGPTSTTKQFLTSVGNGSATTSLSWGTIAAADIPSAALTRINDVNVQITLGGTPNSALLQAVSLTMGWTGQLSVARGGTGTSTLTGIVQGNGGGAFSALTGSANQILRRNPTNTAYEFWSATYIDNVMTSLGDTIYASAGGVPQRLAGNTSTTKMYLSQTGTGTASAVPNWSPITAADIVGNSLTKQDDTNVTLTLGGTPATALLRGVDLILGWTGQLSVSRGGTGASTLTGVAIGNGTSAITAVAGSANQLLRRNASNTAYEFFTPSFTTGSGTVQYVPKWTSATVLGNSQIIDDGTNVGIGIAPLYKLDINGSIGINNLPLIARSGNYTVYYDTDASNNLALGNATAASNLYSNTYHYFRNRGGTVTYLTIDSSGISVTGSIYMTGSVLTGSWQASIISPTYGGTGAAGITGVVVGSGVSTMVGVVGTAGQILRRNTLNTAYEFWTPTYMNNPFTTGGDIVYSNSAGAPLRLPGNTTTTRKYLSQIGDGTSVTSTSWEIVSGGGGGISGSGTANYLPIWSGSTSLANSSIFEGTGFTDIRGFRYYEYANRPDTFSGDVFFVGDYASPVAGKMFIGDGSGWRFHFSKRSAGGYLQIAEVGSVQSTGTTISLTSLSLAEGDVVIVASFNDNAQPATPTGYTAGQQGFTNSVGYQWSYKIMGATPDTSVSGLTAGISYAVAFRNVDIVNVLDGSSPTPATNTAGMPNSPQITFVTSTALIMSIGFLDDDVVASTTSAPANLNTGFVSAQYGTSGSGGTLMLAWGTEEEVGTFDPLGFTGTGTDSWVGCTLALRPIYSASAPLTTDLFGFRDSGQLRMSQYTSPTSFAGTAVGYLAFNDQGEVISVDVPSGGGGGGISGSGTTNRIPKWATSSSLTDSLIFDSGTTVTVYGLFEVARSQAGTGVSLLYSSNTDLTAGIAHQSKFGTQSLGSGIARTLLYAASRTTDATRGELAILSENGGSVLANIGTTYSSSDYALSVFNLAGTESVRINTNGQSFFNGGNVLFGSSGFYYDSVNKRLGIGVAAPTQALDVSANFGIAKITSAVGTNASFFQFTNTGGNFFIGQEGSTGATFGATSYASVIYIPTNRNLEIFQGSFRAVQLLDTGQWKFNDYTSTTSFPGTAAGFLGFTSSGEIITVAAPGGSSGYYRMDFGNAIPQTWSNMPSTLQFFDSSAAFITIAELSSFTQVRLIINKLGTSGAANSKIYLRYSTSYSQTASTYSTIGTTSVELAVNTTNQMLETAWIDLVAGAKADVFIALVGDGGDTAADPIFGMICAEFR